MHIDLIQCLEEYDSIKQRNTDHFEVSSVEKSSEESRHFLILERHITLSSENPIKAFERVYSANSSSIGN